jgi:hypothetical protein
MAKRTKRTHARTSPALLAVGVGATVCLSTGDAEAVSGTKGNPIVQGNGVPATELGGKVEFVGFGPWSTIYAKPLNSGMVGWKIMNSGTRSGLFLATFGPGFSCKTGSFVELAYVAAAAGGPSKYIKIRFKEGGTRKYGWSQFTNSGFTFHFGAWSYNNAGGAIKTLGESVKATRLELTDGGAMLHFTNGNEEGVASYAIEAERDGSWEAVARFAPGDGRYSVQEPGGAAYRLVVERLDGGTHHLSF